MSGFDFDVAIVGAGVVGLACGYKLAERGRDVILLEKEGRIGAGVSSRNSEVVHAGLYYPTGSLKAKFCVKGRRMMYAFAESRSVNFDRCGKLVVATSPEEVTRLEAIAKQAAINEVEGMHLLSAEQAQRMEPELRVHGALLAETSGIIDAHGFMDALEGEIEAHGGAIALETPFEGADAMPEGGFEVRAGGADPTTFKVRQLVTAAGLGAQACAAAISDFPAEIIPQRHLGKGNYFALTGKAPFSRLIYPPPIAGALGTHYRRDLGGMGRFGPDLEWVDEEDYRVSDARLGQFYEDIRRYWPGLKDDSLTPDYVGIRPKIHGKGEPMPDFQIWSAEKHGVAGLVAMFGIESPGLTSSLAIGEYVTELLDS